MANKKRLNIIAGDICFETHESHQLDCQKQSCRQWFEDSTSHNCVILAAKKKGPQKQEKIGEHFGLTRMRVCQIEKSILTKIRDLKKMKELRQD